MVLKLPFSQFSVCLAVLHSLKKFFFSFFLVVLRGLRDVRSLTRDVQFIFSFVTCDFGVIAMYSIFKGQAEKNK